MNMCTGIGKYGGKIIKQKSMQRLPLTSWLNSWLFNDDYKKLPVSNRFVNITWTTIEWKKKQATIKDQRIWDYWKNIRNKMLRSIPLHWPWPEKEGEKNGRNICCDRKHLLSRLVSLRYNWYTNLIISPYLEIHLE